MGDLEAYLPLPGSSRAFMMFLGATATWSDQRHLQTTFGTSDAEADSSGYAVYRARAGVDAAGVGFSATRFFGELWMINVDTAFEELLGSVRDSPITRQRQQHVIALSIAYRR